MPPRGAGPRKVLTVYVDGFDDLEKSMQELGKAGTKKVLEEVGMEALQPVAELMRQLAPDDPNTTGIEDLRSSIVVSKKLSIRQKGVQKRYWGTQGKPLAEVFVGAGALPQAHNQEFGNVNHPAQPFARPAWDAEKLKTLFRIANLMKARMQEHVVKARARAAKKASKARSKKAGG